MENKKTAVYGLLFLILAAGFFLRVYNINHAPPGVYPDEAVNGLDAIIANQTGNYQWFYPANQGREGLFINLVALCFNLFGISVLTLRLPAIVAGVLTIWGTYLLATELFDKNRRIGVIAAFLVAFSFWPMNFSRISFRASLLPFILVFSFYFLFRGINTKKTHNFIIGGLIFGAGLHTYTAFRAAPLILIATLASLVLSRENFLKEYWKPIVTFSIFTTLASAPMLYTFFYAHPEYWSSRSSSLSILSPDINHGRLITTVLRTFGTSLIKYNFLGDQNWRHNFPPYPILDILTGAAFLLGLTSSLVKAFHLLHLRIFKGIREPEMDIHVFLASWFFIMLIPEFLTDEGLPHALRSIGTLPVVFIFAAMKFDYFLEAAPGGFFHKKNIAALGVFLLIAIGVFNIIKYHVVWADRVETARAFNKNLMEVSDFIKTLPSGERKYIVADNWARAPIQIFNWNTANMTYHSPDRVNDTISPSDKNFIVIMAERNEAVLNLLENKFPGIKLNEIKDGPGISYYTLNY